MAKSNYLASKIYQAALKATAFTGAATLYVSLHTADPGQTGTSEVSGNGYARVAVTFGTDTNGSGASNVDVKFTGPTPAAWGTITHVGVWDAATLGNFYYHNALTNPIATSIGVDVDFPVGSITSVEA